jgi:hypothetical protein
MKKILKFIKINNDLLLVTKPGRYEFQEEALENKKGIFLLPRHAHHHHIL